MDLGQSCEQIEHSRKIAEKLRPKGVGVFQQDGRRRAVGGQHGAKNTSKDHKHQRQDILDEYGLVFRLVQDVL